MATRRVLILGAAGRDFHNFNVVYRDDPTVQVVAFTATQIPGIAARRYPPALAGRHYPAGIPIVDESELEALCRDGAVDEVVFAYSDVSHATVMHLASRALAAGADFSLLGPRRTMLRATLPVIAVSAVRTGCGKSQTARWLSRRCRARGLRVAVLRHPMPYGDLEQQRMQRFASREDIDAARCSAEEREEYEPHLEAGNVVFAGVDYEQILAAAQAEADLIVWDGGNNDFPFLWPDLHLVVVDALRPGQATSYHPGETVLRMADAVIVNKVDAAASADVRRVVEEVQEARPGVPVLTTASPVHLEDPEAVRGRRVLVVEDGPTITHGGMPYGAGYVAAIEAGAEAIVDPRPWLAPSLREIYARYPHMGRVLPAVGYGAAQIAALRETIEQVAADIVVSATPIDLAALVQPSKRVLRVRYELEERGRPRLSEIVDPFLDERFPR